MTDTIEEAQAATTGREPGEPEHVNGWRYIGAQGLGGIMPANWVDATGTVGVTVAPTSREVPLDSTDPDDLETTSGVYGATRIAEPTRTQQGFEVRVGLTDTWSTIIQRDVRTLWADPELAQREARDELAAEAVLAAVMFCRRHTPATARGLLQGQDKYDCYPENPYECPATFPPCSGDDGGAPDGEQVTLEEAVPAE